MQTINSLCKKEQSKFGNFVSVFGTNIYLNCEDVSIIPFENIADRFFENFTKFKAEHNHMGEFFGLGQGFKRISNTIALFYELSSLYFFAIEANFCKLNSHSLNGNTVGLLEDPEVKSLVKLPQKNKFLAQQ